MKKALVVLMLAVSMFSGHAKAQTVPSVYVPCLGDCYAGPAFFPFAGAVAFGATVLVLNAEGVSFPACQDNWLIKPQDGETKCYDSYPEAVHKNGV
jgi:hypothetical protein